MPIKDGCAHDGAVIATKRKVYAKVETDEMVMQTSLTLAQFRMLWSGISFLAPLLLGLHCPFVSGRDVNFLMVESDNVLTVAISPDGRMLAGAGFAKAIRIWDARTGELVRSLEGPKRTTRRSIAFSRDGRF